MTLRFPYAIVHDFEGVQANFESLLSATVLTELGLPDASGVAPFVQTTSRKQLAVDYGSNVGVAGGGSVVVSHALGRSPRAVLVTTWNTGGGISSNAWVVDTLTTTTFTVHNPGTINGMMWIAVG